MLKDKNGRMQARLRSDGGLPSLIFFDSRAKKRLELNLEDWGPVLRFFGKEGRALVTLESSDLGRARLELDDPGGKRINLLSSGGDRWVN